MKAPPTTVHIVDDDEAVRSALRLLIRSIGLQAQAHPSAQEFLDSYDTRTPGCLVLDVRMPGMSGLELKRELQAIGASDIPVILITARTEPTLLAQAKASGAHSLLTKPFGADQLIASLTDALAG